MLSLVLALALMFGGQNSRGGTSIITATGDVSGASNYIYTSSMSSSLDGDSKITAAVAALPSAGGVVDTRGLASHTWDAAMFSGVTKPVTLIVRAGTITVPATMSVPESVHIYADNGAIFSVSTGATFTLSYFEGSITSHFVHNGTGKVTFSSTTVTRTVYPEWWGAKSDGVTDCFPAFNALSRSLVDNIVIKLSAGTYDLGDIETPEIGFEVVKNNITIEGAGRKITKLTFVTHPFGNTCGGNVFCIGNSGPNGAYVSGITLRDFGFEDDSPQDELTAYGFPGSDTLFLNGVSNVVIQNLDFINAAGNSAIQLNCSTAAQGDGSGPVLIDNNYIFNDGDHVLFSGINWGGCSPMTISNNHIEGYLESGFIGGGEANRYGDLRIINNFLDATNSVLGATVTCIGPGGVPNHTLYVVGNTCKNFDGDVPWAIGFGNETGGDASDNSFHSIIATDNSIISSSTGPGIGFNLAEMYSVTSAIVANNYIKADYAASFAAKDTGFPNPGVVHLDFHHNVINVGDNHNGFVSVSPSSCELPTGFLWRILDNQIIGQSGSVGMRVATYGNAPCIKSAKLKVAGNAYEYRQYDTYLGSFDTASGLGNNIADGTTATTTRTHYGALPGDLVRILHNNDGDAFPDGITFEAYVSAADTVTVKLTNNSGSAFNAAAAGLPTFIVERRY